MWIGFRVPQFRGDPIFESFRDEMFKPFRLIVNLVPRVVEEIMEEALQQTVVTKDLQSAHLPGCSQTRAVVLFVFHQGRLLGRELLEHSSDGGGTDTKMPGKDVAGGRFLLGAAQLENGLQIIVNRLGVIRARASRWH